MPSKYFFLLSSLSSLIKYGVKVYYLQGNHDFSRDNFLKGMGINVLKSPTTLYIDKKKTLLAHGDEFSPNPLNSLIRRALHHPYSINLYSLIHPDIGVPFAFKLAELSRKREKSKGDWLEPMAKRLIGKGYEIVIFGHTHRPVLKRFSKGWYLNLGDWINHFTYGLIEKGTPYLRNFLPE